jgi:hypothetical protein
MEETTVDVTDPFYSLDRLADAEGKSLSNREMDDILWVST